MQPSGDHIMITSQCPSKSEILHMISASMSLMEIYGAFKKLV